jgi:hypothetical protein
VSAGDGDAKFKQAQDLEQMMVKVYGPDFRDLSIVGPMGTFHLAGAFEECGLQDPATPLASSGAYGLWQISSHEGR